MTTRTIAPPLAQQPLSTVEYRHFVEARGAMLRSLVAWMKARPDPDDVLEEIEGGAAAMRQLYRLWLAGAVP